MEKKSPNMLKSVMNSGAITGSALIIVTLLIYMLGQTNTTAVSFIGYALLAFCLYFFTKKYRDEELGGYISYSQSLGFGVLIGVFAGILLAFFTYIEMKYIDSTLVDKALDMAQENLLKNGSIPEEQIEKSMEMMRKFMNPPMIALSTVFSYAFLSLIISLITSAIIKKERSPFDTEQNF
jgi:hypothetical protein